MLVLALVAIAVLAPQIVDLLGLSGPNVHNPSAVNSFGVPSGPSSAHPFGVDPLGRDLLARVVYGLRSSLEAGAIGATIAALIGAPIGFVASSAPRWAGAILMGVADALLAFPALLLGLGFASGRLIHPGLVTVVLIIVLTSFPYVARSARWRVRSPSFLPPGMAAYSLALIPPSIVLEAGLSFLGAGLHGRMVSLGAVISGAGANITGGGGAWWYLVFPGLALLLCVLAFGLLASRLVRACEPPLRPSGQDRQSLSRYIALLVIRAALLVVAVSAATYGLFSRAARHRSIWDLLHLDLGHSARTGQEVLKMIVDRLPATVSLLAGGLLVCLVLSATLGILLTRVRGGILNRMPLPLPATPVFWVGLLSVYLFSTSVGRVAIFDGPGAYTGLTVSASRWFGSLLLPWLVLAGGFVAFYARRWGSSLAEAMAGTYIRTAQAKGLSDRRVFARHGLRAAIPPIVPVFGLGLGGLLGGVLLIETVFKIPGVGRLAYEASGNGDVPVVEGVLLMAGYLTVLARLMIDIAYALLDPRIRRS